MLTGCGDDGPVPEAAATITVSMDDFTIDSPAVVPAGLVEVHGLNDGDETHQAVFAELPDGVTANEYVATFLQAPGATLDATDLPGGLQFVRPGHGQDVMVQLEPGRYLLWCGLPGPGAGELHLTHGMWTEVTVEGTASDAPILDAIPSAGTIELINWAFVAPDTLRSGEIYTVVNSGTQVHEIGMASLADGATRDDVLAFLSGRSTGRCPSAVHRSQRHRAAQSGHPPDPPDRRTSGPLRARLLPPRSRRRPAALHERHDPRCRRRLIVIAWGHS